jgi:hypothetical protein
MSTRQSVKETALCGTVVLAVWFSAWLSGFGSAVVETTAALPVEHRSAALLSADTKRADAPQPPEICTATAVNADAAPAAEPEIAAATAAPDAPKLFVEAAPIDSSPTPAPELPLVQMASASSSDPLPIDIKPALALIEIPDECLDTCVDRYLWALYQCRSAGR